MDRFVKDGTLRLIARGVYLVEGGASVNLEEAIKETYIGFGEGMTIGCDLYRHYGIAVPYSGPLTMLSNATAFARKRIGDILVCGCKIIYFCPGEKRMTELLEVLAHSRELAHADPIGFDKAKRSWATAYSDFSFKSFAKGRRYDRITVARLEGSLSEQGIENNVHGIYDSIYGFR